MVPQQGTHKEIPNPTFQIRNPTRSEATSPLRKWNFCPCYLALLGHILRFCAICLASPPPASSSYNYIKLKLQVNTNITIFQKSYYFGISPCIKRDYHSRKERPTARGHRKMSYKQCKSVLIRVKNRQLTRSVIPESCSLGFEQGTQIENYLIAPGPFMRVFHLPVFVSYRTASRIAPLKLQGLYLSPRISIKAVLAS